MDSSFLLSRIRKPKVSLGAGNMGGGGVEWPKGSIPRFDLVYCAPNQLKLIPHRYNSISGTLNGRKQVENRKRN